MKAHPLRTQLRTTQVPSIPMMAKWIQPALRLAETPRAAPGFASGSDFRVEGPFSTPKHKRAAKTLLWGLPLPHDEQDDEIVISRIIIR